MRCTFCQLCKRNRNPNFNPNSKTNPNHNPSPNPNPNSNVSALRDWLNIAQFVKYCEIDKLISGAARLVKRAIEQIRTTLIIRENYQ